MTTTETKGSSDWWRTVIGEFPTGVALITTTDGAGDPVAMIVGTFTAVSQDPPIVGFFPVATSNTWKTIQENGGFTVSVLGSRHEALSRAVGNRVKGYFAGGEWVSSPQGNPRVVDALAWFDCRLGAVHEAGDHLFAMGEVHDYGTGDGAGGLPLLFLRGGYGTFSIPTETFDVADLSAKLRMVTQLQELIAELADRHDVGALLAALAGDSVVVLAEAGSGSGHQHGDAERQPLPAGLTDAEFGLSFPFAAPMAPVLAAWAPEERTRQWLEGARHLIGSVDRTGYAELLETVRGRGYALSMGDAMVRRFDDVVARGHEDRAELVSLWRDVHREQVQMEESGALSSLQVPVFDAFGHAVMEIVVTRLERKSEQEARAVVEAALDAGRRATEILGGRDGAV